MSLKALLCAAAIFVQSGSPGPSDELFDTLKNGTDPYALRQAEEDIWAGWMESGSPTVDLLMERGMRAHSSGQIDLARDMYDRVIQISPDYAEVWNRRAALFIMDDQYDEALQDLNEAIRLEPRHFGAWLVVGRVLTTLEANEEALVAYRNALRIHPNLQQAKEAVRRLAPVYDGRSL